MTTVPALTAIPGTVLATAALTSQEALAAVQDPKVFENFVEAENLGMVAGMFAILGSPHSADLRLLAGEVTPHHSLSRDLSTCVADLRKVMGSINRGVYHKVTGSARRFGLAVFGHAAPAVSATAASDASTEVLFARRAEESRAPRLSFLFCTDPIRENALLDLIKMADKGFEAALYQLAYYRNIEIIRLCSKHFTREHVEALASMNGEIFLKYGIGRILDALREVRPDLFPGR